MFSHKNRAHEQNFDTGLSWIKISDPGIVNGYVSLKCCRQ